MALINRRTREIHFKIVYYGCGLCGKTTNLKWLHDRLPPERCGKLISIATDHERTLFFDFLPIELGQVNGYVTRFHLYTVPGQVYYKLSRKAVLQGVDGLVFVADSHPAREYANRDSLADLHDHLRTLGLAGPHLARLPWVFQWNKRDLPNAIPVERLRAALNPHAAPEFEAVASTGAGVNETLRATCKQVLARLASGDGIEHAAAPPAAVTASAPAAAVPHSPALTPSAAATASPATVLAPPRAPAAAPEGAVPLRRAPAPGVRPAAAAAAPARRVVAPPPRRIVPPQRPLATPQRPAVPSARAAAPMPLPRPTGDTPHWPLPRKDSERS